MEADMAATAGSLKLKPHYDRILATVLHIMKEMPDCDQYQIVKIVFLADREHLNRYGRPITFDNYSAMEYGPVPTDTYNMVRASGSFDFPTYLGLANAPWTVRIEGKNILHFRANIEPDYATLSQSDIDILNGAIRRIRGLSFDQIHNLARNDPAYKEAWRRRGTAGSLPMKYELLIDERDPEIRGDVCHLLALSR